MDKNQAKTDKNEHENERRSKAGAGEGNKLKKSKWIYGISKSCIKDPWTKFEEFGKISPPSFIKLQKWSLEEIIAEKSNLVPHESENYKRGPWIVFLKIYRFGPCCLQNYINGHCKF